MARLDATKITTKAKVSAKEVLRSDCMAQEEPSPGHHGQQKRPEKGQFCLQVDRQTKASYATYEAAEQAALVIKKAHPIVRVVIYDTVECVDRVIELP